MRDLYDRSVFINCPFSSDYQHIFRAILFSVYACGYRPRCSFEIDDSSQSRLSNIENIIEQCRFGIHDISYVTIDKSTKLPRFNMPFELGLFLSAKRFGPPKQRRKLALILDKQAYRYRSSLSDISGQDIAIHQGRPDSAISAVRNWLNSAHPRQLPGGPYICRQYAVFTKTTPCSLQEAKIDCATIDLRGCVSGDGGLVEGQCVGGHPRVQYLIGRSAAPGKIPSEAAHPTPQPGWSCSVAFSHVQAMALRDHQVFPPASWSAAIGPWTGSTVTIEQYLSVERCSWLHAVGLWRPIHIHSLVEKLDDLALFLP